MFRPQMRRRRHALDTYVHGELEERGLLAENDPIPLRPSDVAPGEVVESQVAGEDPPSELSA